MSEQNTLRVQILADVTLALPTDLDQGPLIYLSEEINQHLPGGASWLGPETITRHCLTVSLAETDPKVIDTKFQELMELWEEKTGDLSSPSDILNSWPAELLTNLVTSYPEICLPLLEEESKQETGAHRAWLLLRNVLPRLSIQGPEIKRKHYGIQKKLVKAWKKWFNKNRHLWSNAGDEQETSPTGPTN